MENVQNFQNAGGVYEKQGDEPIKISAPCGMPQSSPFPINGPNNKCKNKKSDERPENKAPKRHIPLRIPGIIISSESHKNNLASFSKLNQTG